MKCRWRAFRSASEVGEIANGRCCPSMALSLTTLRDRVHRDFEIVSQQSGRSLFIWLDRNEGISPIGVLAKFFSQIYCNHA
jgi:hypothetical protein